MDAQKLGEPNGFWSAPVYSIKVRGLRYVWGSAGLIQNLKFEKPFILHLANDRAGEAVTIGTHVATGANTNLGTIQPGECVSVSVNEISGIYADCALETIVHCLIY
jgi:hypothetical protein